MNDHSALGTVRDSLSTARDSLTDIHMTTPLDAIVRQGRARRSAALVHRPGRHRRGRGAGHRPDRRHRLGASTGHGHIRTAVFTLVSNADGTATLTINKRCALRPGILQSDLAHVGIPAKVTAGSFLASDPGPTAPIAQVV